MPKHRIIIGPEPVPVTTTRSESLSGQKIALAPCRKCWQCLAAEHREWSARIIHEAACHEKNTFITLTYRPGKAPANNSLSKRDVQNFMKRLRKNTGWNIRYYIAGEYGDKLSRPHYHIILFGVQFPDKKYHRRSKQGFPVYRSEILEKAWKLGFSEVGEFTEQAAGYTANYTTKKIKGKKAGAHYQGRIPEFSLASRNPPIGFNYYLEFKSEIDEKGTIAFRDREIPVPKIYKTHYHHFYENA